MKKFKKYLAITLAMVLTLSTSVMALADDATTGAATGTGNLEGTVATDVYNVVLPTVAEGALNFTLDPEQLIANTDGAKYGDVEFEEGATLYFKNVSDNTSYSSKSDALTVVNKSTYAIDVTVSAEVTNAEGITLTDDNTFADDTSASVYLALADGTSEAAITSNGASIKAQVAEAPDGAYEYSWTEANGYKYELVSGNDLEFEEYSFNLTGASNTAGDWSTLEDIAPAVEVTWNIKEHKDNAAPAIANTAVTFSKANGATVSVDLGGGDLGATGIASVATVVSGKEYPWTSGYSLTGSTLKFETTAPISSIAAGQTRTVKVVFDDEAATAVELTVTIAN